MEIKYDVHYGPDMPHNVVYAPDMVYINIGLHLVEVQREEELSHEWVADEMHCYTYAEYTEVQDLETRLAEDRAVTTAFEAALELIGGN